MATGNDEILISRAEIVSPGEVVRKFFGEATSAETAAALFKFSGGRDTTYTILKGVNRRDKSIGLVIHQTVEGVACAYIMIGVSRMATPKPGQRLM